MDNVQHVDGVAYHNFQVVVTEEIARTYRALKVAAERIGLNNFTAGIAAHRKAGRSPRTYHPTVSEAHKEVIAAMGALAAGEITANEAMGLLHAHDVNRERLGGDR